MTDFAGLSVTELERRLARLQDDLEDVREERVFVLGQTGLHVSAGEVKRYEAKITDLETEIAEIRQAVDAKKASGT